jgi:O-succinylbenzoate synthase
MNHIRIQRLEMVQVAMVPREPHVAAHGTIAERPVILLRLWDDDGAYGWGECVAFPTPGYLSETVDGAWDALENGIMPAVHNRRFESPDDLADYLAGAAPRTPVAAATVEMAAWDMVARRQGRSLSNLLGGTRGNIATGKTIGLGYQPEALAAAVAEARQAGYQRIKIKVEPSTALGTATEAIRAAADVPVVADANASFSPEDIAPLRQLDAVGLAWIEQPFPPTSLLAVAKLQNSLATPIALDESAGSLNTIRRIIEMHGALALSIKPGRLGGHSVTREVYKLAHNSGLSLWIGGMLETGVGRAHNLALASLSGFNLPGDMGPSAEYWTHDVITEPLEMVAGHIGVPTGPGIGVEVDTDYLLRATLRRHVVS